MDRPIVGRPMTLGGRARAWEAFRFALLRRYPTDEPLGAAEEADLQCALDAALARVAEPQEEKMEVTSGATQPPNLFAPSLRPGGHGVYREALEKLVDEAKKQHEGRLVQWVKGALTAADTAAAALLSEETQSREQLLDVMDLCRELEATEPAIAARVLGAATGIPVQLRTVCPGVPVVNHNRPPADSVTREHCLTCRDHPAAGTP